MMNLADASGRTLEEARFSDISADPSVIEDSRWNRVHIDCRQNDANLSGVRFARCQISESYLGGAKLCLDGALFEDCELRCVTFMYGRLHGATFRRSRLVDCLLRSADLRESCFEDCEIVSTDFAKASFSGAMFDGTELLRMENWGWEPFEGAKLDDAQRFKHFIAADIRQVLSTVSIPSERLTKFVEALDKSGFGEGEAMYLYDEWRETISFDDFVAIGKAVTQRAGEKGKEGN